MDAVKTVNTSSELCHDGMGRREDVFFVVQDIVVVEAEIRN
jgi:hypothetical protein